MFILHAEIIYPSDDGSEDKDHTAFLSVVNKTKSKLTVIKSYNVSKYIDVFGSDGMLSDMGGLLEIIPIKNDTHMLHLNTTGSLSGNGNIFSSSDVFFLIGSAKKTLTPILELLGSANFGSDGVIDSESSYTSIYIVKNEQAGTQIFTQDYKYEKDSSKNIDRGYLSPDIKVYEFDFKKKKYALKNTISKLPSGATEVGRTETFDVECTSDCNRSRVKSFD